ncbi:MAG: hypothetical protein OEY09_12055 [Gammaproteobacteria bacterium]|nr:hypothetical protein [Gammaproteobacteria bacterium]
MKIANLLIASVIAGLIVSPVLAGNHSNKHKKLPYGLQLKLNQGKPLPPGWERKLSPGTVLNKEFYNHGEVVVPVDKDGLLTLRVEGKLIRLYEATREISEILN